MNATSVEALIQQYPEFKDRTLHYSEFYKGDVFYECFSERHILRVSYTVEYRDGIRLSIPLEQLYLEEIQFLGVFEIDQSALESIRKEYRIDKDNLEDKYQSVITQVLCEDKEWLSTP